MTYAELGQKVKEKYPDYASVPDEELGKKVAQKYPSYQSQITSPSSASASDTFGAVASNPILQGMKKTNEAVRDTLFVGPLKGIASTVAGLGSIGERALNTATGAVAPNIGIRGSDKTVGEMIREKVAPTTTAQKLGFGLEQAAEYFTPLGGEELAAKGLSMLPKVGKAAPLITKVGQAVIPGIAQGLEAGAISLGQTGNVGEAGGIGLTTAAISPVAAKVFPKIADNLERINLRLTPAQVRDFGTKIDDATDVILKNNISGSPAQRVQKIDSLYSKTEDAFQNFLKTDAKGITLPRKDTIEQVQALKANFKNDRDLAAIESQIDEFANLLKRQPKNIPIEDYNALKRSVFNTAYNSAGTKVRDDVEFAIGDIMKKNLESATAGKTIDGKTMEDFNKNYSSIITARKLLKAAEGRKEVGLIGRLLSTVIGGMVGSNVGGHVGTAVGGMAGDALGQTLAGTGVRSALSQALLGASRVPLSPITGPTTQGIVNLINRQKNSP